MAENLKTELLPLTLRARESRGSSICLYGTRAVSAVLLCTWIGPECKWAQAQFYGPWFEIGEPGGDRSLLVF